MASDLQRYVPLKTIVAMFLDQYGKSDGDQDRYWVLAFRAMADNYIDLSAQPKTIMLPLQGNKTAKFPSDYLSWSKIGLRSSNGQISNLKINDGLMTLNDLDPNRMAALAPQVDQCDPLPPFPYYVNYFNNGTYYNLYGFGGGLITYGDVKVDERNRVLIFPPDFQYNQVVFEYLSAPEKDNDYMVPFELQEAIIAFLEWKSKLGTEKSYHDRQMEGRRRLPGQRVTMAELSEILRENNGMYLKA